ncbi:hypothetical protein [Ralstonia soli]|uniref:Carboxypeptidase regulatory-like domain-containing protein n=1 Tax=Ralstonia soli TaxID=2953896 RepID=A0ABT1AL77_9RALS|nr:hypothetical protein [Ralstonia soli]MCO5398867.1 hypothetical protein [Ralstonia soli]
MLCGVLAALALTAGTQATAAGPDIAAAPEVRFQNDIAYVSGGIGRDERDAMHAMAGRFNVRLNVVDAKTGEALSDVDVSVADDRGMLRLRVRTEGPLLYMRLPHGRYQITAAYRGVMQSFALRATTQPVDAVVRLRVVPGAEEWLLCKRGCSRTGANPTTAQ